MDIACMRYSFSELHLDVARNSTDDFNLFHDKNKWQQVDKNPFSGPILLGFQLEMLIEGAMRSHRIEHHENSLIVSENLLFSNYQFSFTNAVSPGQQLEVIVKKSKFSSLMVAHESNTSLNLTSPLKNSNSMGRIPHVAAAEA